MAIPSILVALAVGFLASACTSKNSKPPRSPRAKAKKPKPEFQQDFGQDLQAKWIHWELLKRGFSDTQMDQGCPTYRFPKPGHTIIEPHVGKKDSIVTPCEVYEFTLDRWQDPKIRPLAEKLGGKPLPWSLDDFDPNTGYDEAIRKQIVSLIQKMDSWLTEKNFRKGTPEYEERMAVALFAAIEMDPRGFDALASDPTIRRDFIQSYLDLKKDLERLGLEDLWEKIKIGGLRVYGDYTKEYSALEALRHEYGECTEHAKILYGAFKLAGLDPYFISLKGKESRHPEILAQLKTDPNYFHLLVGLTLGGKTRLFDGALLDIDPPHPKYLRLSLRQYLSLDLSSRALFQRRMENQGLGFELDRQAMTLDPWNIVPYSNSGYSYGQLDEFTKALEVLNSGLNINPYSGMALVNLGETFRLTGQIDQAEESYNRAIRYEPDLPDAYLAMGLMVNAEGDLAKSLEYFTKAFRIAPIYCRDKMLPALKKRYKENFRRTPRVHFINMKRELGLDPILLISHFHMIQYLYPAGYPELAREPLGQLVETALNTKAIAKEDWSGYSPFTLHTLYNLYEGLPSEMRQDPEVKRLWNLLELPPRPPLVETPSEKKP